MRDVIIPLECLDHPNNAGAWASSRFDRALLVLGDLTRPLRHLSKHWAAYDTQSEVITGLAVRFEGFDQPIASIVAEGEDAFGRLLIQVGGGVSTLVCINDLQQMPANLRSNPVGRDKWMVAPCLRRGTRAESEVMPIEDVDEFQHFLQLMGMHFWNPAMLRFGHAFGIRSPNGQLVCAGGVNFILPDESYAQIGPLVTDRAQRGKLMATSVLDWLLESLAEAGIAQCGVFADESNKGVVEFYKRRGFVENGQFRFLRAT